MFGRSLPLVLILVLSALAPSGPVMAQGTQAAQDVLTRMARRYSSVRSYRDQGDVTTQFIQGDRKSTVVRPFRTEFVRPGHFRYQFTEGAETGDDRKLFVVWTVSAPEQARRWWTVQPEVREDKLKLALAGGMSISGGSSMPVPALLMPDTFGPLSPAKPDSPVLAKDETIDGVLCHCILGRTPAQKEPMSVWLGKDDLLIRRIKVSHDFGEFKSEDTATYKPQVDIAIPADTFRFEPPR